MTARGRGGNAMGSDWDPMRSEYETSMYETNDEEGSSSGQLDHCRLYITNIPKALNEDGLRASFAKYGTLSEVHVSGDPTKRYALVKFETPGEAKLAMMKLNHTEPLKMNIAIAYKQRQNNHQGSARKKKQPNKNSERLSNRQQETSRDLDFSNDNVSVTSSRQRARPDMSNGDDENYLRELDDMEELDPDLDLELERLRLQAAQLLYKQRLRDVKLAERRTMSGGIGSRCVMADGKILVRTTAMNDDRDNEGEIAGAGDSKRARHRPCESWRDSSSGRSTPSTCVVCSSKPSDSTKRGCKDTRRAPHNKSETTCELKYSDLFYSDEEPDETDRLIKLRSADYLDIVDESLKIVIALAGYPKAKVRLQQMELFKKTLADVMDMQLKAGLLKKTPAFLDYYINRGAIVCICKDMDTRDWMIRISQGLQERMNSELVLFKAKVKRLCLAVLRIPEATWPATAQDVFKLLQYFNPTLKTDSWKVYSQKTADNVECTYFLIDRVSGEIIRGPTFKNVIDYKQMEFEFTGYTEIYYECFLNEAYEDLRSVASRVKLLDDIRSSENTPRNASKINVTRDVKRLDVTQKSDLESARSSKAVKVTESVNKDDTVIIEKPANDVKRELEMSLQKEVLQKLKNVQQYSDKEVVIWSGNTTHYSDQDIDNPYELSKETEYYDDNNMASASIVAVSDKTESIIESSDNLLAKNSNVNIDSSRGIAYHRRTNYLHVENELKIAITLDGYPQNKLEGTHIRRLKHLFKEYLNKDLKQQRFANLIIPKFHDIYLSNGAVIYICDSLETKDYLAEILPKFIHSTGLKLAFRDIKHLVRYTRIVMRLPKDYAHVESIDILQQLKTKYPDLKPDCWKYYSDVAGKQKRQFGVDPVSLDIIKSPDFDPIYEGEKLIFRIIDRQKRDVSYEDSSRKEASEYSEETKKLRERVLKMMYCPINPDITKAPLTRIRTNHYCDLIADDLKMYVGPSNYPETRVDEHLFHSVKRYFEIIMCESLDSGVLSEESMPRFHDMYLFDGVIFIICVDFASRHWVDKVLPSVSIRAHTPLKSTEFRGAVGIISMYVATTKDTDEVIEVLQKQNPRLRTKYWRKISTVKTKTKLDVVLQIDKLSAQVINDPSFNSRIGSSSVQFKLGHLQSLIKPKQSLEELTKKYAKKSSKTNLAIRSAFTMRIPSDKSYKDVKDSLKRTYPNIKTESWTVVRARDNIVDVEIDKSSARQIKKQNYKLNDVVFTRSDLEQGNADAIEPYSPRSDDKIPSKIDSQSCHVTIKLPQNIIPESTDDLQVIFNLLEDYNPGLNTELWTLMDADGYGDKDQFHLVIDKQSATVIQSKKFKSNVGGEKVKFLFD